MIRNQDILDRDGKCQPYSGIKVTGFSFGMNISFKEPSAINVRFDTDNMWIELADGRMLGVPLACFPRLLNAPEQQRESYTISGGGTGLHWEEIDEDICVKALIMGVGDRTRQ